MSQSFGKDVDQLLISRCVVWGNDSFENAFTHKMTIHFNVLSTLVKYWIISNVESGLIIAVNVSCRNS